MRVQTIAIRYAMLLGAAALAQLAGTAPAAAQVATLDSVTIHFGPDQTPNLTENSLRRTRIIETKFLGLEDSTPVSPPTIGSSSAPTPTSTRSSPAPRSWQSTTTAT